MRVPIIGSAGFVGPRLREAHLHRGDDAHVPYDQAHEPGFDDMSRHVPDITKAGSLIGFRPSGIGEQVLEDGVIHERRDAGTASAPHATSIAKPYAVSGVLRVRLERGTLGENPAGESQS